MAIKNLSLSLLSLQAQQIRLPFGKKKKRERELDAEFGLSNLAVKPETVYSKRTVRWSCAGPRFQTSNNDSGQPTKTRLSLQRSSGSRKPTRSLVESLPDSWYDLLIRHLRAAAPGAIQSTGTCLSVKAD